jgi:uncharacterized protein (DUF983 family)
MAGDDPGVRQAVFRGLRRRCPRCGDGPLFRKWFTMHERCSSCDLCFEGQSGDLWGFWVITDRIFLFGAILALYFGFTPESWIVRGALLAGLVAAIVVTMPHRQGAFVALDYLSRTRWRS